MGLTLIHMPKDDGFLSPPASPFLIYFYELINGTIVGLFYIVGKVACREFAAFEVVLHAFTANAFSATRFVATVALRSISPNLALFHVALLVLSVYSSVLSCEEGHWQIARADSVNST